MLIHYPEYKNSNIDEYIVIMPWWITLGVKRSLEQGNRTVTLEMSFVESRLSIALHVSALQVVEVWMSKVSIKI